MNALPRWADVMLLPVLNVVLAFLVGGLIVLAVGQNPLEAVRIMLYGAFGYGSGFGYTLYYTTDFIFAGLAVSLAYHAGLFNIGPEGQAYVGGLGVILIGLAFNGTHWAIMFPMMIIAGQCLARPGPLCRAICKPSAAATSLSPPSSLTSLPPR